MKLFLFTTCLVACSVALAGCDRSASNTSTSDTEGPAAGPTSVRVIHPQVGAITRTLTLPGVVEAWQEATLYAKVSGYLRSIHVDIGDSVKEGDLLAELEAPEMLADRRKLEVELAVAERDYLRVDEARASARDLVMPATVDEAKGRYEVKQAEIARLDTLLAYARITAPFNGIVTHRNAHPGAFIPAATNSSPAESTSLLHLSDFSKVRVEIDVPEVEVPLLKTDIPVHLTAVGLKFEGRITRHAHAINPRTKTMKAEIEIDNPDLTLRPGMMVAATLDIERRENTLLLPAAVLILEKRSASVFVVRDGIAVRIPVETGFDDGKSVEITSGLTQSDAVVSVGKQQLSNGQAVRISDL